MYKNLVLQVVAVAVFPWDDQLGDPDVHRNELWWLGVQD